MAKFLTRRWKQLAGAGVVMGAGAYLRHHRAQSQAREAARSEAYFKLATAWVVQVEDTHPGSPISHKAINDTYLMARFIYKERRPGCLIRILASDTPAASETAEILARELSAKYEVREWLTPGQDSRHEFLAALDRRPWDQTVIVTHAAQAEEIYETGTVEEIDSLSALRAVRVRVQPARL